MLRRWQIGKVALSVGMALISNAFAADNEGGKLKVSGFLDGYFTFNTSNPATVVVPSPNYTFKVENALHNFTFRNRRPRLQLAEIVLEHPMTEKRFGFRLDLDAGTTTEWVHQAEPAGRSWAFVQQAFVSVPLGKGYLASANSSPITALKSLRAKTTGTTAAVCSLRGQSLTTTQAFATGCRWAKATSCACTCIRVGMSSRTTTEAKALG